MKFVINSKTLLATLAIIALTLNLVSSVSIRKTDSENLESRRRVKHVFTEESNPPYKNKTNYTMGQTFNRAINNSIESENLQQFTAANLNSKFHAMFDKQLEELFLIFKKNKASLGIQDFRSAFHLFIKNFNACDKNHDLLLDKKEFGNCMKSDPYLSLVQQPSRMYSTMRNFTNTTAFNDDIFNFANNYDVNMNFYDYVMMRLFAFAWRKCTVSNKFMDESNWECGIDITSGTKSLNTHTLRNIFQLGLKLTNSKSMPVRTLDFLTFYALGTSIRLFGKINAKENFDATLQEFNIALDTNILPTRYNQDIINQLFRLTRKENGGKNGLDLYSFVFYDHYLKLFYQGASNNRWSINPKEFAKICSHWMFPQSIFNYMTQVPTANFTSNTYNLRAHINNNHLEEEEFSGKFLELKTKRYNNTSFNVKQVDARIFRLLDSNSNHFLTFYDFANFIQTFTLYEKTDSRDSDRVIVSDIAGAFSGYSSLPLYSSEFRARSNRFNLLDSDIYIDPFYTLAVTRMDDYVHHYIRRSDPTTVKEIELHLILDRINLKNFPAAHLDKCARGKDSNGIPLYDWECSIIAAINKALKYLEYTRDMKDIKSHGFNLTYTQYDYANSK